MISYPEAQDLLNKHVKDKKAIEHAVGVSNFAFKLAKDISTKHPELNINPEKVKIAALLHDIGKIRDGVHEINSVEVLQERGFEEIAEIVIHGYIYEKSVLRGAPDENLLPKTLENKIVAYADFRFRYTPMTLEERIAEIKTRKDEFSIEALTLAEKRYHKMEDELLGLTKK